MNIKNGNDVAVAIHLTVKNVPPPRDLALAWNIYKCHNWEEFLQYAKIL